MSAHPVDEKLPALKMATTGLQHVAAMYAAAHSTTRDARREYVRDGAAPVGDWVVVDMA
ncbi:hypothetical protein ACWCQN_18135 [Streptomyces sp. NPDC001984]